MRHDQESLAVRPTYLPGTGIATRLDADYVFYELTRSICPICRTTIDAQIVLRDGKVFMRKRCPEHGQFEALVYADAQAYTSQSRFNKPGTVPLAYTSQIEHGCPHDCGLCPDHQQHACLGIIEINSACNMQCPLCFANAGARFSLTLEEVEDILDGFVRTEGYPEVVQFSGGEPTIHPVGLSVGHIEAHNEALAELVSQVRGRLLAAEIMTRIQHVELPSGVDLKTAKQVARSAADAINAGTLGYTLIIAGRDSHAQ